uniref:Uncharacterized protein n=1 Tax=Anguilla anguilla TaxID=7936 RepID=A0A0E9PHN1_ANGAN
MCEVVCAFFLFTCVQKVQMLMLLRARVCDHCGYFRRKP